MKFNILNNSRVWVIQYYWPNDGSLFFAGDAKNADLNERQNWVWNTNNEATKFNIQETINLYQKDWMWDSSWNVYHYKSKKAWWKANRFSIPLNTLNNKGEK